MTQYMLSVHGVEGGPVRSEEETQQAYQDVDAFNAKVMASGVWVFGGGLHPASTATTVRIQGDDVVTTDGPFAETKEQLGGFWIVDVPDLDAALALAAEGSRACLEAVEVRPFQDMPEA